MKRIGVFRILAICGIVAIGTLTILLFCEPKTRGTIVYITTTNDTERLIATVDPLAPACAQPTFLAGGEKDVERVWWSPRRDEIVYMVGGSGPSSRSIWVMQSDGSGRKQLAAPIASEYDGVSTRVSFDKRFVALLRKDDTKDPNQWRAFVLDPTIPTPRPVMTGAWFFTWSPTENVLAISRWVDGAMYVARPDGTVLAKHDAVQPNSQSMAWSPDGQEVAFAAALSETQEAATASEIYSIDIRTGRRRQLTKTAAQYSYRSISSLTWSPDRKHIAFVSNFVRLDKAGENSVLFVLDTESGRESRLADHVEWTAPVWSSDGKQIAFVSTKDGPEDRQNYGQIYSVDIASGRITQLTCHDGLKESLSW